jgi:hypothetical protein
MDTLTMNAVGITIMAIFGLWAFCRGAKITQKRRHEDDKKDKERKDD